MSAYDYESLKAHLGHKIVIAAYGYKKDPDNVAIECVDCNEVLLDYDKYGDEESSGENLFYLCYEKAGENCWEIISGEDAMQQRVCELSEELDLHVNDIVVFNKESQL